MRLLCKFLVLIFKHIERRCLVSPPSRIVIFANGLREEKLARQVARACLANPRNSFCLQMMNDVGYYDFEKKVFLLVERSIVLYPTTRE